LSYFFSQTFILSACKTLPLLCFLVLTATISELAKSQIPLFKEYKGWQLVQFVAEVHPAQETGQASHSLFVEKVLRGQLHELLDNMNGDKQV